jgi:hypothetical protein
MRSVHLVVGLSLVVCAGCAAEPGEDLAAEELAAEELSAEELESRSDERGGHRHCPDDPVRVETLADAAARADRLFGAAVSFDALTAEPEYRAILEAEFNDVTPENATKWGPLQPVSPDQ